MTTPLTRQQLQGMVGLEKMKDLTTLVSDRTRERVLEHARQGRTSFVWIVCRGDIERELDEMGWANSNVTMDEILRATQTLYPDCTVTLDKDVSVRKGVKIDWS